MVHCGGIWNCKHNFENKDAKRCFIWNDLELQRKKWKQGRLMVHSDGIRNYLELQGKILKSEKRRG